MTCLLFQFAVAAANIRAAHLPSQHCDKYVVVIIGLVRYSHMTSDFFLCHRFLLNILLLVATVISNTQAKSQPEVAGLHSKHVNTNRYPACALTTHFLDHVM